MRYLLPLFECEIETMILNTNYYRKKDYFIIIIVYLVMSLPYINKRQIIIYLLYLLGYEDNVFMECMYFLVMPARFERVQQ